MLTVVDKGNTAVDWHALSTNKFEDYEDNN